ncbi:hypothetical protein ACHAXT_012771 [Thalassiosira profunda]
MQTTLTPPSSPTAAAGPTNRGKYLGVATLAFLAGTRVQRGDANDSAGERRSMSLSITDLSYRGWQLKPGAWSTADETNDSGSSADGDGGASQPQGVRGKAGDAAKPVEKLILLGERHSGTNWITDHLRECFGDDVEITDEYKRQKHWFQEEDLNRVPANSAVVVAMFRDPYNWVEAMRVEPHHSPDHVVWHNGGDSVWHDVWYRNKTSVGLDANNTDGRLSCWQYRGWRQCADAMDWKSFVTKPWIGRRGPTDQKISATPGGKQTANCFDRYRFSDMSPCSRADSPDIIGLGPAKYDFQHDGSERGFSSIVDLRRAKILNHLSVADFRGTRAFFPFRFEDLNMNGTAALLRSVEGATGFKAKCNATMGKAHWRRLGTDQITHHDELPVEFVEWMNEYVDWEVEKRVGYHKR